jgi:hypothetical protein
MVKLIESIHYKRADTTIEVWVGLVEDKVKVAYIYNAGNYWKLFKSLENLMNFIDGENETGYYELSEKEYNNLEVGFSKYFSK